MVLRFAYCALDSPSQVLANRADTQTLEKPTCFLTHPRHGLARVSKVNSSSPKKIFLSLSVRKKAIQLLVSFLEV